MRTIPLCLKSVARTAGFAGAVGLGIYLSSKSKHEFFRAAASGGLGAILVELFCHPFDTVNMRAKAGQCVTLPRPFLKSLNLSYVLDKYHGVGYVYYGYMLPFSMYFGIFHSVRESLRKRGYSEGRCSALASGISEFAFVMMVYPMELFKTRAQVALPGDRSVSLLDSWAACKWNEMGKKFYVGLPPHLLTYVSYTIAQFGLYHWLTHKFWNADAKGMPPFHQIIGLSALSGALASIASNPFETLTVVYQTKGKPASVLRKVFSKEYVLRGIGQRVLYNALVSPMLFLSLEFSSYLFRVQFSH